MTGRYTNYDTLSTKVESLIQAGTIQAEEIPLLSSPKACLNWDITYQIYDCLYEYGSLTPTEIDSFIKHGDTDMIAYTLERMSDIGITKPINFKNLTRGDLPTKGLNILPILHNQKKWELTENIRG